MSEVPPPPQPDPVGPGTQCEAMFPPGPHVYTLQIFCTLEGKQWIKLDLEHDLDGG